MDDVQFLAELWSALSLLGCPSCPEGNEARAQFGEDFGLRLTGMLGPFIVAIGVVGLVLKKLDAAHQKRTSGGDRGDTHDPGR